jgi:outer membrane protein
MIKTVSDEINTYLEEYGNDKGYTFFLSATGPNSIIHTVKSTYISEDIIKGLNAQYNNHRPSTTR